jgi:hypothetical protein
VLALLAAAAASDAASVEFFKGSITTSRSLLDARCARAERIVLRVRNAAGTESGANQRVRRQLQLHCQS